MKKIKSKLPIFVFMLLTILNYILGIWLIKVNDLLGASSTVQLFLFSLGREKIWMFIVSIVYNVAFWVYMIISCTTKKPQKSYAIFITLLLVDVLISISLIIFQLYTENYVSIYECICGVIARFAYIVWTIVWEKKGSETGDGSLPQ